MRRWRPRNNFWQPLRPRWIRRYQNIATRNWYVQTFATENHHFALLRQINSAATFATEVVAARLSRPKWRRSDFCNQGGDCATFNTKEKARLSKRRDSKTKTIFIIGKLEIKKLPLHPDRNPRLKHIQNSASKIKHAKNFTAEIWLFHGFATTAT